MQLRVEGLTKVFGDLKAVDSLSFTLGDGEIWGFIGPNGAGKTTTLRILATVDQPTDGDAWADGHSVVKDADKVRPLIGFMPDFFGAYPDMLVSEYLDFFARSYGLAGAERTRRIDDIVAFTEIGYLLRKRVSDLSKGMRQRISLGRSLIHDPELLLLDEPAAGLDPQARKELRELLRLLAGEEKTVFISSHILAELEDVVDNVVIIKDGRLIYAGPIEERDGDVTREFTLLVRLMGQLREGARLLLETPNVTDVDSAEPDLLRVRMNGGPEAIARAVERLVEAGHRPYQVTPEGRRLEDMFLEATSGEADDRVD